VTSPVTLLTVGALCALSEVVEALASTRNKCANGNAISIANAQDKCRKLSFTNFLFVAAPFVAARVGVIAFWP
jgi:hypothetical protein